MLNFKRRLIPIFLCVLTKVSLAQELPVVIYPQPHELVMEPGSFPLGQALYVKPGTLNPELQSLLNTVLKMDGGKKALPLTVLKSKSPAQRSGAYQLTINKEGVKISAADDRGVFYAAQTLIQLANAKTAVPYVKVTDYPDVPFRGTVEGFYGEPWTQQDRIAQLRFYGQLKLNTYIYGPKDDPYHSSPNWRLHYPEKEEAEIKQLVQEAKKNYVDFVWAIHPGKDIKWNLEDSTAVLKKFEMMYGLGVRSFAVFFDDISGVGTDAGKQAGLLNYIQYQFVNKKKDVTPLIMCPTEYNKSWSDPKPGTYLDILGEKLDPAIHIMWTGNTVVADITKEGLEWVNKRIRRPAFVWWNFPVSDYVRDHLLMGPSYGIDIDAQQEMSGFVSNPMDKAEPSKTAIFGVAGYTWNMKNYDPEQAWLASHRYIMPEASAAFQLFNAHNSDPGANGHRYRRTESVEIKPYTLSFLKSLSEGGYSIADAQRLKKEFEGMIAAAKDIPLKSQNKRLVEQISPWLQQFDLLGKAGLAVMDLAEDWNNKSFASAWGKYLQTERYLDEMTDLDKRMNLNPYQPGVKTGSLVMTPFVKSVLLMIGQQMAQGNRLAAAGATVSDKDQTTLFSNAAKLKSQPLQIGNQSVAIAPVLETITLKSGEYFGLRLHPNLKPLALQFNLESASLGTWGIFESSADGINWKGVPVTEKKGNGKANQFYPTEAQYIRFRNQSDQAQNFYLKLFKLEVKTKNEADNGVYVLDGNLATFSTFSKHEPGMLHLPKDFQQADLRWLLRLNGQSVTVFSKDKRGKEWVIYKGGSDLIKIEKSALKNIDTLYFKTDSAEPLRIYEITKY
ncbi:beta-N-acetylglucosaminidase domain-containing protein [Pedobacter sp. N36a]|uniref:beta-N-acetylglucosaminidase domain-containing protein n=1 Tax=Pedobacter sp. N36a TaxID=2767996 RepID=UPI001656B1FD|nr:beta-N-acetylglucosaminidase domain-containing protein [Pedobacter sp. N36a]MBC8986298.1 beta-N-acetylglucosaminidase domain-containing protein [Pedobacter sp. N36a]